MSGYKGDVGDLAFSAGTSAAAIDVSGGGYEAIYLLVSGAATGTVTITECDTASGTYAAADAGDVLGATAIADGDYNVISYIGCKRYIKATVTGAGNAFTILWTTPRRTVTD